jgi:hypothetical protein
MKIDYSNIHFKHCKDSYLSGEFLDMTYFERGFLNKCLHNNIL